MKNIKLVLFMMLIIAISSIISAAVGLPMLAVIPIMLVITALPMPQGVLREGIFPDVWADYIIEKLFKSKN